MSASFANNRPEFTACDDLGDSQHPIRGIPQTSTVGVDANSSNDTAGTGNQNEANLKNDARPRWDQPPLAPSSSGDALTRTHAKTTVYTESVYEYDENGVAEPAQQKKKKMASPSVYSYNSGRDISQFIKDSYGRAFNKLNDSYLLPSDESEWSRLDKQHVAQAIAVGKLTPCQDLVDAVLAPEEGVEKKVLDLGCGSGIWPIEMARKYPHTSVLGVDVAPVSFDSTTLPTNLEFEIDDINEGLEHFHGKFDVVHIRSATIGIHDFDRTMQDIQLCAKPGGVIIFVDGDINICDEDRLHAVKIPDITKEGPDSPGSWFRKIIWESHVANGLAGANHPRAGLLIDLGLWNQPTCDPETAAGGEYFMPIGPWAKGKEKTYGEVPDPAQTQQLNYVGSLMRQVFLNIHRAVHPVLLRFGMDQQVIDEWSRKVEEEIGQTKLKLWVRFRFAYARRRAAPDQPAPPLPPPPPKSDSSQEHPIPIKYPYITYFKTAEEAARNVDRRREANPPYPESECERAWLLKQMVDQPQVTIGQATE